MILESIRLKNIKCYGEGPGGNGVTVQFAPGINRIAGRNGDGKTTLIEALGFALFGSKPAYEENFKAETYLLRSGEKSGEIEVIFQHEDRRYQLELPLGNTSRSMRIKVVDLSDGSVCAEDEKPVRQTLSRMFGMPSPDRLEEMFARLIGVKQGRLTWPFDSKRADAARHFEPLLDVETFRACFDRLKPAQDRLKELSREQDTQAVRHETMIAERAGTGEAMAAAQLSLTKLEAEAAARETALEAARKALAAQDALAAAARTAREQLAAADAACRLAATNHQHAFEAHVQARAAAQTLADSAPAHAAWLEADAALRSLQLRQGERTALQNQRTAAAEKLAQTRQSLSATEATAAEVQKSQEARAVQLSALHAEAERLGAQVQALEPAARQAAERAAAARQAFTLIGAGLQQLPGRIAEATHLAAEAAAMQKELAAWDRGAADAARKAEEKAAAELKQAEAAVAEARSAWKSLQTQLDTLQSGICPFLKETCRQFDPARVQEDLRLQAERGKALATAMTAAAESARAAAKSREQAERHHHRMAEREKAAQSDALRLTKALGSLLPPEFSSHSATLEALLPTGTVPESPPVQPDSAAGLGDFSTCLNGWWRTLQPQVQAAISACEAPGTELQQLRLKHESASREAAKLKRESEAAHEQLTQTRQRLSALTKDAESRTAALGTLDEKLKAYDGLDALTATQQQLREQHSTGHDAWVRAQPQAARLPECEAAERAASEVLVNARRELDLRRAAEAEATRVFAPAAHTAAQQAVQTMGNERSALISEMNHARTALGREQQRVRELAEATAALAAVREELDRLKAASDLVLKARETLRDAAPLVAQHHCTRIAARAQQIVNRIGHETLELEWNADSWSLRIEPGQRRFAMLSGGEQTKLALAMTLAMIEHFCGLGFCLFDEPTYGVDADSRQLLADSIIAAHKAAGFQQLLLVSHDDAFDGRIEHTILLRRTAGHGTRVVMDG